MARRTAYLCIGLPDALGAGTTADILAGSADTLAVSGHDLPASPETTRRAAWELTRDHEAIAAAGLRRRDVEGTWESIWRRAYRERSRSVVVAEERLAGATRDQVELCLDAMAGFSVHVVVLASDPADLLARAWTDAVRRGRPMPLLRFADRLEQAGPGHQDARRWWAAHDLGEVLARWSAHVPAERIHVVAVSGDNHDRASQAGEALGTVLGTRLLAPAVTEQVPAGAAPRALPSTVLSTMRTAALGWADLLRDSSYDVHGEVGDLVPRLPDPARATVADLSADDRLHLAGDALADALVQLEGLRRENAVLRRSPSPAPRRPHLLPGTRRRLRLGV